MTDEDLIKQANATLMAIPEMLPQNMTPYLQKMFITGYRVCEESKLSGTASKEKEYREALEGLYNYTKNHKDLVGFIKFEYLKKKAEEALNK